MKHPSREKIERYIDRNLNIISRIKCASHLKKCPDCSRVYEELKKEREFIESLKSSCKRQDELDSMMENSRILKKLESILGHCHHGSTATP